MAELEAASTERPDASPGPEPVAAQSDAQGPDVGSPPAVHGWGPRYWLAVAIVAYIGVSLSLSILRLLDFTTSNWDLGIFQQALWSAGHGKLFYESGDYEFTKVQSFLQSHPSFILFGVAPLYNWMPTPILLFVIQSAAIGLAAIPLYLSATKLSGSKLKGLIAGVMFLVWTPVLSGNLYDFHLEAFLPLELFWVFYFMLRRSYAVAILLSVLPAITIEVGPVLTFAVGAFFAWPTWKWFSSTLQDLRPKALPSPRFRSFFREGALRLRGWISRREVVAGIALMGVSFALYVLVREAQGTLVLEFLPPGSGPAAHLAGFSLARLGITWGHLQTGLLDKLIYWTVVYALLAFIPFRAPKTVLLVLPWWVFTVFSGNVDFSKLGYQYGLVAAAPVLIGFAYGLTTIPLPGLEPGSLAEPSVKPPPFAPGAGTNPQNASSRSGEARAWALVIGIAIVANVAFSPVNPLVQFSHGQGPGYDVGYSLGNGTSQVLTVASFIPHNATVVASDNLFPFVANDNNAFSLTSTTVIPPHLPLNATNMPSYVFLCEAQLPAVPLWFSYYLYNSAYYGLRAVVGETSLGPVLLFQAHYSGPTFGVRPIPFQNGTVFHGRNFDLGGAGIVVSDANDTYSTAIRSVPGINDAIWYGPYTLLPAGDYNLTILVHAWVPAGSALPAPAQGVLTVEVSAWGHRAFYSTTYTLRQIDQGNWTSLEFTVQSTEPLMQIQVVGVPTDFKQNVVIEMNYLIISQL